MLKEERLQSIVRALQEGGSARVSDLAETLASSRATIWRDLDELSRRDLVTKVHGGATLAAAQRASETSPVGFDPVPHRAGATVGFQVPASLYFFGPIIEGAKRACELAGAELMVSISGYADEDVREAVGSLLDAEVDGLLLTPTFTPRQAEQTSQWINALDRPVVLVERESLGLELPGLRAVSTTREAGSYEALRRVIDDWQLACRDLDLNTGCEHSPVWIGDDPRELVDSIAVAGVTGVLVMNDALAARMLRELRRAGLRVPDQLSLIAYDDEIAEHLSPSLTAISPAREQVGFVAAQQLLSLLSDGDPGPGRRITIDPTLRLRDPTAPPPAAEQFGVERTEPTERMITR